MRVRDSRVPPAAGIQSLPATRARSSGSSRAAAARSRTDASTASAPSLPRRPSTRKPSGRSGFHRHDDGVLAGRERRAVVDERNVPTYCGSEIDRGLPADTRERLGGDVGERVVLRVPRVPAPDALLVLCQRVIGDQQSDDRDERDQPTMKQGASHGIQLPQWPIQGRVGFQRTVKGFAWHCNLMGRSKADAPTSRARHVRQVAQKGRDARREEVSAEA